jgi:CBS domain containing-hemolysin-like protein
LAEFGKRRLQLAIVTDSAQFKEQGGEIVSQVAGQVVGLITQEDLLEQLVGEIVDEWDKPIDGVEKLVGDQLLSHRRRTDTVRAAQNCRRTADVG